MSDLPLADPPISVKLQKTEVVSRVANEQIAVLKLDGSWVEVPPEDETYLRSYLTFSHPNKETIIQYLQECRDTYGKYDERFVGIYASDWKYHKNHWCITIALEVTTEQYHKDPNRPTVQEVLTAWAEET